MHILYLAYGSNLRSAQMQQLCPGHDFLEVARLENHRLGFTLLDEEWQGGIADVLPSPGDEVWGALYRLDEHHLAALDAYEVCDPGGPEEGNDYVRRTVTVIRPDGTKVGGVWCYFVRAATGYIRPSAIYRTALIEGAVERGLPPHYIKTMQRAFEGTD